MEFINGIEVLSESIIYASEFSWGIGAFISCIIGIALVCLLMYIGFSLTDGTAVAMGLICILLTFLITKTIGEKPVPTDKCEYKVTISDEVNFKEFNDKYEIKNQDGKIYTIIIKEDKK